jgi:hypothetical protein
MSSEADEQETKAQRAIRANESRRKRYDEDPEYRERRLASGRDFKTKTKEKRATVPERINGASNTRSST